MMARRLSLTVQLLLIELDYASRRLDAAADGMGPGLSKELARADAAEIRDLVEEITAKGKFPPPDWRSSISVPGAKLIDSALANSALPEFNVPSLSN